MKKTGYLLLFLLTLFITSCSEMSDVMPSQRISQKNDMKPMKTLEVDGNAYVIGWQLEVKDSTNYRRSNNKSAKEESYEIEVSSADLESDNTQVTTNNYETNETQRKIKGYQATVDPNTGKIKTYPVYEDD